MNIRLPLVGLLCALAAAACATASPGVNESGFLKKTLELPGNGADCVFGSVRDFSVLDDDALLLYTSARNRAYYVEIAGICPGLNSAFQIGFEDRDGRLCGFGLDAIILGGGAFSERCSISRIHKLEDGDIARVLEHYGRVKVRKQSEGSLDDEKTDK
ncbi:MAG: hypothetical protein HKN59_06650 [Gammaproteobacteria bacterium]|nr:hypothetical protein [Gammaproteobacteria bacterium]